MKSLADPREPHPVRGPFSRWPHVADASLALVILLGSLITVAVSALEDGEDFTLGAMRDRPVAALVLLVLAAAALLWRRTRPIAVTTVELVILLTWAVAGYGDGHELALIVAVYSVGRYTSGSRRNVAMVGAVVAISVIGTVIDPDQRVDIAPAVILTVVPWYLGVRVRNRGEYVALLQERAARLEAEQQAKARQAVAEERARIARELHDVVAHRVSMMTVQAGAARTIARHDLEAAIEAMGDVEEAGRHALGELRHLLGVLRPDPTDSSDLGPQPGLSDVPALLEELAHTGAAVTLTLPTLPDDLPAAVDLSAYRIVQESVTNIIKHGGPQPTVEVTIELEGPAMLLHIFNTTPAPPPDLPSSGFGIAGMRERADILGGSLTADREGQGAFHVRARLPLQLAPS